MERHRYRGCEKWLKGNLRRLWRACTGKTNSKIAQIAWRKQKQCNGVNHDQYRFLISGDSKLPRRGYIGERRVGETPVHSVLSISYPAIYFTPCSVPSIIYPARSFTPRPCLVPTISYTVIPCFTLCYIISLLPCHILYTLLCAVHIYLTSYSVPSISYPVISRIPCSVPSISYPFISVTSCFVLRIL